ncbi:hypothetical protein CHUAL_006626 [Chamberlinius hualienensis]
MSFYLINIIVTLLVWISTICFLAWVILILKKRHQWISLIEKIPGPSGVPLLGVSLQFLTKRENITPVAFALTEPYAANYPIMKIWLGSFPIVLILKADAAKILLSSNQHIEKAVFYKYLHSWIGDGLVTSTGQKWQMHRKLITPCFHFRVLDNFLNVMNEQATILAKLLEEKCKQMDGEEFDVYPYIARCALDTICTTAMGQVVNAQINADSEYVNAINNLTEIINLRMLRPWLAPDWIFRLTSMGRAEQKYLKIIHNFTDQVKPFFPLLKLLVKQ